MKQTFFTLLFCFSIGYIFGQSVGDYRSRANGLWHQSASWQVFFNGAWRDLSSVAAGPFRNIIPTSSSGAISIIHALTVNSNLSINQTIIEDGARIDINPSRTVIIVDDFSQTPLQISSGGILLVAGILDFQSQLVSTPCVVDGILASYGMILSSNPSLLLFGNGSYYLHSNVSGGSIPLGTWAINSTCQMHNGLTASNPQLPNNLGQAFGNFTWNTPLMGSTYILNGALTTVNGNLTILTTGARDIRLKQGGPGYNLTIGGNLIIQAGILTLTQSLTSTTTLNIGGDIIMSGGTLNLATSNNSETDVFLNGNLFKTSGVLTRVSGAAPATIRFNGAGSRFYSNNGNITTGISFSVQNGTILNLGTSFLTGTGTFTLNPGGTVNVGSTDPGGAIQLGTAAGNIRMAGPRFYATGTTIVYTGTGPQFMGSGHPASPNTIIQNPTSVTLVSDATINGTFTVSQGTFDGGTGHNLTLARNLVVDGAFEPGDGEVIFGGAGPQSVLGSGNISFFDLSVNQTAPATLDIVTSSAVNIENSLDINSASTMEAGNQLVRLVSNASRSAYVAPLASGAAINGTVIAERHLPNNSGIEAYRYIAPPTVGSFVSDWQNEIAITGTFSNPSTGPGIEMPFSPSMFLYDETFTAGGPAIGDRYRAYPTSGSSTTAPIQNGRGYSVYVRNTGAITMDTRGTLGQGPVPVALTNSGGANGGWNLIGNPYPAPLDWDLVAATLPGGGPIYNAIYFTDRTNNGGSGGGSVAYINGVGTPASYNGIIAQGQAFFVNVTANASLTFQENQKFTGQTQFFREREEVSNLLRVAVSGNNSVDEVALRLHEEATDSFDSKFDALEFPGDPNFLDLSMLTASNEKVVINSISSLPCGQTIPLLIEKVTKGTYTLSFTGIESFDAGMSIKLKDKFQDQIIDLIATNQYSFTIEDGALMDDRFEIMIGKPTIETDLEIVGASVCEEQSTTLITIQNSQRDVEYSVQWNNQTLSAEVVGNGTDLEIPLSLQSLPTGEHELNIHASMNSCSSADLRNKAMVKIVEAGIVNSVKHGISCGPGTVSLRVEGSVATYNWYNDLNDLTPLVSQGSSEFFTPALTKSKTYYVAPVNAAGCEGKRVEVQANIIYLEEVNIVQEGNILISNYNEGNTWYLNGVQLEDEFSKKIEVSLPGLYSVEVKNQGCKSIASTEFFGAEEFMDGIAKISVYPNPTVDKATIEVLHTLSPPRVNLVSSLGVELSAITLKGSKGNYSGDVDLVAYPSGIYIIKIQDGSNVYIKKISKSK